VADALKPADAVEVPLPDQLSLVLTEREVIMALPADVAIDFFERDFVRSTHLAARANKTSS
jgi:hypothetical protein